MGQLASNGKRRCNLLREWRRTPTPLSASDAVLLFSLLLPVMIQHLLLLLEHLLISLGLSELQFHRNVFAQISNARSPTADAPSSAPLLLLVVEKEEEHEVRNILTVISRILL